MAVGLEDGFGLDGDRCMWDTQTALRFIQAVVQQLRMWFTQMTGYIMPCSHLTTKAEAIPQGRQPSSLIFMTTLYNVS